MVAKEEPAARRRKGATCDDEAARLADVEGSEQGMMRDESKEDAAPKVRAESAEGALSSAYCANANSAFAQYAELYSPCYRGYYNPWESIVRYPKEVGHMEAKSCCTIQVNRGRYIFHQCFSRGLPTDAEPSLKHSTPRCTGFPQRKTHDQALGRDW